MRVVTIGGATLDTYLVHSVSDSMQLRQNDLSIDYMLLRAGSKIEVTNMHHCSGGGATNAAVSFKQQGYEVATFCNLGTDENGNAIIKQLKSYGIDTSLITQTTENNTATSFIIKAHGHDRTIFAYRGANKAMQADKIPYDAIKTSNQLYITSLSEDSAQLLPDIASFAHKHKVPVAINPGMSQLSRGVKLLQKALPYLDIFILNYEEAKSLMLALAADNESFKKAFTFSAAPRSCPIDIAEIPNEQRNHQPYLVNNPISCENLTFSIRHFFQQMFALGPRIVVVTNSSNGVYVGTKNAILFHPSLETTIVDTVGAGDSFGSCFVGSLGYGDSVETALRNGIVNAASVLQHVGAKNGLLTREALQKKTATIDQKLIKHFDI